MVDFHPDCAVGFFGSSESYVVEADSSDFNIKRADKSGYKPALEALTMRLAQSSLILTEPSTLARDSDGEVVYLSKRDCATEGLDKLVERLDDCEFDGSVEMIAELVESFSSISRLDVVTLFEQVIFGWATGCSSMSLGSFALARPNAGVCSLAAAYDLVPTALYDGGEDEFSPEVNGKRRGVRRSDFEAAMRFMDLKDRIIRITIEKIVNSKDKWFKIIDASPLSLDDKQRYKTLISSRLERLMKK